MREGLFQKSKRFQMIVIAFKKQNLIQGKCYCHTYPHLSMNSVNIGTKIYDGLQELILREIDLTHVYVLTIVKNIN